MSKTAPTPTPAKIPDEKRYIIRKFVMAQTAAEAIRKEGEQVVDEVFLDDEWQKNNSQLNPAVGFSITTGL